MRRREFVSILLSLSIGSAAVALRAQAPGSGPMFDVVSIKRHVPEDNSPSPTGMLQRLNGSLTISRVPVAMIITLAYPPLAATDIVGLPDWALGEFYEVAATASLANPTPDDRAAMVLAMLADRFKLQAHRERREVPTFDLVVARSDGKVGPGLMPSANDCEAVQAERLAAAAAAMRVSGSPPPPQRFDPDAPRPCLSALMPNGVRGELTLATLAGMLRRPAGRLIVNKTGLIGWYQVTLTYDVSANQDPAQAAPPSDGPSVFTAVREQLGLRLEPSRTERDVLVIDRLERPTEN
jgi:uncharacterized protein (TIGR03435 family)